MNPLLFLIKLIGRILAWMPDFVLRGLTGLLGDFTYFMPTSRRRLILSNLHHAFPEKPHSWHKKIARESCRRTVEMGILVMVSPFKSEAELKKRFCFTPEAQKQWHDLQTSDKAVLTLTPHFSLMESLTFSPLLASTPLHKKTGVIFRPFGTPALDQWVKQTRERFGLKLLSRKQGFNQAREILRQKGIVGILFDQNAGYKGSLISFFNRAASAPELPGLLGEKYNAELYAFYPKRTGFLQGEVHIEKIPNQGSAERITKDINGWLEQKMKSDERLCASWLWLHKRWGTQDEFNRRFQYLIKKNWFSQTDDALHKRNIPKNTRIWIRMPNWLGDIVMAIPVIKALRDSRPDLEITLIAKKQYLTLLETLGIGDKVKALPKKGWKYFGTFWKWRLEYPDTYVLFTNSFRGDLEAYLTRTPQRFGMLRPGKKRSMLTHAWHLPEKLDETLLHQTYVWEKFLKYFGLNVPLRLEPLKIKGSAPLIQKIKEKNPKKIIGLIPGTENTPEKRWPIENWSELIQSVQQEHKDYLFLLLGTQNDKAITDEITKDFSEGVINLAGKTSLTQLAEIFQVCDTVVCNDTGGMHLANALGTAVIAVYGPTNPIRTGPIFEGEKIIIQPEDCPPTGGSSLSKIKAKAVKKLLTRFL